jgi:hypothetical protein
MALATTVSAVDCVPVCDTTFALSDAQFFLILIDRLATAAGVDLADITSANLNAATYDAMCDLEDRIAFYNASPEQMKAIALYLLSQV